MRVALLALCCACSSHARSVAAPKNSTADAPATSHEIVPTHTVALSVLEPPDGVRLKIGIGHHDAALSPTGEVVAIATGPRGVELLDVASGRGIGKRADLGCTEPEPGYFGPCTPQFAFTPDGKRLALRYPLDGRLVVLTVPALETVFEAKVEHVVRVKFTDDGRLFALGPGKAEVFDAAGARSALPPFEGFATDVSPEGRTLLLERDRPELVAIDTGKPLGEPPADTRIRDLVWAADGVRIASTGGDWSDIVAWRRADRVVKTLATSQGARQRIGGEGVHGFAVPAPFDRVYVGMSSGVVAMTLDGAKTQRIGWLTGWGGGRDELARVGPDGLVVLDGACPIRIDAEGMPVPGPLGCPRRPSLLAFDGDRIVSIPWSGGIVQTFDTRSGALRSSNAITRPYPASSATLAAVTRDPKLAANVAKALALPGVKPGPYHVSRDGKRLFVNAQAGGRPGAIVELADQRVRADLREFLPSEDGTRMVQLHATSPDVVEIRDIEGEKLVRTLPVSTPLLWRMALSSDGTRLAFDHGGRAAVIDTNTGDTLLEANCSSPYTGAVALSRDGSRMACDTRAGVEVYDVRSKQRIELVPHPAHDNVDTFAFSEDGRQLAISVDEIWLVDL